MTRKGDEHEEKYLASLRAEGGGVVALPRPKVLYGLLDLTRRAHDPEIEGIV